MPDSAFDDVIPEATAEVAADESVEVADEVTPAAAVAEVSPEATSEVTPEPETVEVADDVTPAAEEAAEMDLESAEAIASGDEPMDAED